MRKTLLLTFLLLLPTLAMAQKNRKCTEQDLPIKERKVFIRNAEEMLRTYYSQLPLAISDPMVQESFIEQFMTADATRYKPEFPYQIPSDAQYLKPDQYLLELDKTFAGKDAENIQFLADNIQIDTDDFYMNSLISCYLIATYDLTLTEGGTLHYKRRCKAYCLFPKASVSINVLLMQVEPVKDIVPWKAPQPKNVATSSNANTGQDSWEKTSVRQLEANSSIWPDNNDKPWPIVTYKWMEDHILIFVCIWFGLYVVAFLYQLIAEREDWEWSFSFFETVSDNCFENIFSILAAILFFSISAVMIVLWLISLFY